MQNIIERKSSLPGNGIRKRLAIKTCFVIMLALPFAGQGQEKGVHFEDGLSWTAVKAKAKAENKYIFVDYYTTWCGPCKYMKSTVFPQEESGNFFNAKFISIGVQLDSTKGDNEAVKKWYRDAHEMMQQYNIAAYPTFLMFGPDGRIVHRTVGSSLSAKDFIARVQDAFDPEKQYYTQLQKFKDGQKDSAFLRKLTVMASEAYDMRNATPVAKAYFATQKDLLSPGTLSLLNDFTNGTKDEGFDIFYHHPAEVDKILGAGTAKRKVREILIKEYVFAKVMAKGASVPDWKAIQVSVAEHYPDQAGEVTALGKVGFYQRKNDWNNFQTAVVDYMDQYGVAADAAQLNSYAWTVFQHCPDMHCVSEALEWSKRSFKDNQDPGFMDTYANILYKMGKKDDAIAWEEKARDLSAEGERKSFQETIDKMKKGEKTWD
jgi:thioredoxin-related protein